MTKHDELKQAIQKLIEANKWLNDCPFDDGQAYFETAERSLVPLRRKAAELFMAAYGTEIEDEPDLEWGSEEYTEAESWQALLERVEVSTK